MEGEAWPLGGSTPGDVLVYLSCVIRANSQANVLVSFLAKNVANTICARYKAVVSLGDTENKHSVGHYQVHSSMVGTDILLKKLSEMLFTLRCGK